MEEQGSFRQRAVPAQVDVQRLMGDVSLGSSPSIGQGMGTLGMGSGMMGQPGMSSMGSAPTPRALVQSSAFASSQSLQNRNLSDLGSYLELLSLARGQDQVCFSHLVILFRAFWAVAARGASLYSHYGLSFRLVKRPCSASWRLQPSETGRSCSYIACEEHVSATEAILCPCRSPDRLGSCSNNCRRSTLRTQCTLRCAPGALLCSRRRRGDPLSRAPPSSPCSPSP